MEEPASAPSTSHSAFDPHRAGSDTDEEDQGQEWMARGAAAGLEEGLLKGARGRFRWQLGWVDNDSGKGFKN